MGPGATVLTIAGFDPSSGAGATADLMVFAAHGLFGTSALTALTVQSTVGVRATHPVDVAILRKTLRCLAEDLPPAGIKIGMLGTAEHVLAVAEFLDEWPGVPVVLDPVVRSSSGRLLLSEDGVAALRRHLLPRVTVVTPNADELWVLSGTRGRTVDGAVSELRSNAPLLTVVVTGGHSERPDDLVLLPGGETLTLRGEWVETRSTHGTGCAFASALLSGLVLGAPVVAAADRAKRYVAEALRRASPRGAGRGPMALLWPLQEDAAVVRDGQEERFRVD